MSEALHDSKIKIDRIVGGENAQRHAWRWVAYFYGCGATLIAADWAVTAAHCCTIPGPDWSINEPIRLRLSGLKSKIFIFSEAISLPSCPLKRSTLSLGSFLIPPASVLSYTPTLKLIGSLLYLSSKSETQKLIGQSER